MKLKVGDQVLVTAGKDKGKQGQVIAVQASLNTVTVEGLNLYFKHQKPVMDQPGQKSRKERPLPTANVAIVNDQGQPDRVGYVVSKSGQKERVFRKTGKPVTQATQKVSKKTATKKSTAAKK